VFNDASEINTAQTYPNKHKVKQVTQNMDNRFILSIMLCMYMSIINPNRPVCIRFSLLFNAHYEHSASVSGVKFEWVDNCRYLGIVLVRGKQFRCSSDTAKSLFFTSFNSIFNKVGRIAPEEVVINLLCFKCIPVLLYGVEACPFLHDK